MRGHSLGGKDSSIPSKYNQTDVLGDTNWVNATFELQTEWNGQDQWSTTVISDTILHKLIVSGSMSQSGSQLIGESVSQLVGESVSQ